MTDFSRIEYYDLAHELANSRLPECVGREILLARAQRTLHRSMQNSVFLSGPNGCGKTSILMGLAGNLIKNPVFENQITVQFHTSNLQRLGILAPAALVPYQEAFLRLSNCVILIDDFGNLIYNNPAALQNWITLLRPVLEYPKVRLVCTIDPSHAAWLERTTDAFANFVETVTIEEEPEEQYIKILGHALPKIPEMSHYIIGDDVKKSIVTSIKRFPSLGQLPKASLRLLDDCIAELKASPLTGSNNHTHPVLRHMQALEDQQQKKTITQELLNKIIAEKTGIPVQNLTKDEKSQLKQLPQILNKRIVGQKHSLDAISSVIQRARLGLRNQQRPLASFLVLGPSGVGKTETAKLLAEHLYGKPESFLRIDMSEFTEGHTIARLIGPPPGYMGFDSGGQLTNHLEKSPYSLILLDEIEKAHGKIFDIFLQLLDDGRLTSGKGQTVDATQSIIMATSNLGVENILEGFTSGEDIHSSEFIRQSLMSILTKHFRTEFINRFDAILVYDPLSKEHLKEIALMEIKKIEQRVSRHNIHFNINPEMLEKKINELYDPRLGARPVKRFVEEICETLISQKLLS